MALRTSVDGHFYFSNSAGLYPQFLKDLVYTFLTGAVAYWLVYRLLRQRYRTHAFLEQQHAKLGVTMKRLSHVLKANSAILHAQQAGDGQPLTTWVSENVERITGYTFEEALEEGWWKRCLHPEDIEQALSGYEKLLAQGRFRREYRFIQKNGEVLWLLDDQRLIKSDEGQPLEIIGTWTDITERKVTELALQETKAILQAALDQSQAGIIVAEAPSGQLRYANKAALRIRGASAESVVDGVGVDDYAGVWRIFDLAGRPMSPDAVPLARAVAHGEHVIREIIIRRGEDDDRIVVANAAPIKDAKGTVIAAVVVFLDVTDLKRTEAALRHTEARFVRQRDALAAISGARVLERDDLMTTLRRVTETTAKALRTSRASIWRYDEAHTQLECFNLFELVNATNSAGQILHMAEFPEYFKALAGEEIIEVSEVDSNPRTAALALHQLKPLGITSMLVVSIHLSGSLEGILCLEHIGPPRQWSDDERSFVVAVANLVALAMEVWERCQAEASLRASQERLQRAISASKVGLWDWDLVSNTVYYTPQASDGSDVEMIETSCDYEEWVSRIHPEDTERAQRFVSLYLANPNLPYSQEFRMCGADGTYRWLLAQGTLEMDAEKSPIRLLGSHMDITERKRLEAEFFQAQKMESVGRLAGGVAHDFNNLLTVISGYTEMGLGELAEDHPLYSDLLQVRRAAERATDLTRQLLAFSRRQVLQPEVLILNGIVTDAETMLRRLIGEDVTFVTKLCPELGKVVADPGQMEQVIMNLVINARDAMPTGGTVIIETYNVSFEESVALRHVHLLHGPYVCVAISDTGTGMDKQTQEKIFEPFFTTKAVDKGTGLGLATVYGIVKQSGGSIMVYSEIDHGTTFKVYLPQIEEAILAEVPKLEALPLGGSETILLVEDEDALRLLAERILAAAGYKVFAAANGAAALNTFAQGSTKIDLLLTDVIMPGISGRELARQLGEGHPELKVLYMSGYTDTAISVHGVLEQGTQLLNKPFTAAQLTRKIREVLDKPTS